MHAMIATFLAPNLNCLQHGSEAWEFCLQKCLVSRSNRFMLVVNIAGQTASLFEKLGVSASLR